MYGDLFKEKAESQAWSSIESLADCFESLVDDLEFNCLEKLPADQGGLAQILVGDYLQSVHWSLLAEKYFNYDEK